MATFKVHVKWGKEKFENVEVDTAEPPEVFKAQLFALSGVPPERQKVMTKGAALKDDSWGTFKLKNGITLLMMGSADPLHTAPATKIKFIEDMTEAEVAHACHMPAGLANLGNTCYMNATVQCLKTVDELKDSLSRYQGQLSLGNVMARPAEALTIAMRDLYKTMDKATESLPPIIFLQVLHSVFPHFAEKAEQGGFQQQDANECWSQIVLMLQQRLPAAVASGTPENEVAAAASRSSFIDQYFGISLKSSLKCVENDEEAVTSSAEKLYQLSCFISQDVKFLHTGLRSRMKESITKNSPTLNRDAQYIKTSSVDRLPAYLSVQFVRFFYKEKEKVNAKILKDVKFPLELDVYDICSTELQEKLVPMRDKFKQEDEKKVAKAQAQKAQTTGNGEPMEVDSKAPEQTVLPHSFENDVGSNNSGYYELSAVLTHRGRSSSSGHYVAWVRQKGDAWIMCDDEHMTPVKSEDILRLSGGGDWHCAYVLLYSSKKLTIEQEKA